MTLPSDTYFKNGVNIHIFIEHMQRNFILTDVMKTGYHQDLENFISMHSMKNQNFEMTGEYYDLHNYDLDSYDRRFAVIDVRLENSRYSENQQWVDEFHKRCDLLRSQGFVFICATPWESVENVLAVKLYPRIKFEHIKWTGGVNFYTVKGSCL